MSIAKLNGRLSHIPPDDKRQEFFDDFFNRSREMQLQLRRSYWTTMLINLVLGLFVLGAGVGVTGAVLLGLLRLYGIL